VLGNLLVGGSIIFILINLIYFFKNKEFRYSYFSTRMFYKLFFVLTGVMIAFAVLYYGLGINGTVLRYSEPDGEPVTHSFSNYLYFSGVTLLAVGYGDFLPVGHLRFFALMEAAIGLLLPSAYFMKMLNSKDCE
jgi:potassium channel LctB